MAVAAPIRILCFGASITAGWNQLGRRYYPYASTLEARLKEALPKRHISIQVDGLPGDTVMYGQYTERLRSLISTAATPYDFIIVQGGGNDLLMCGEPQEIFGALRKLWSIAFEAGSKVIALTVTKTIGENDRLAGRYDALNELIVSEEHEKLYSVDVSKILSPTTMDKVMVSRIYDRDGVHFGKKGYEMMGDAIASSLAEMIQAEPRGKDNADPTSHSPKHHFNASNSEPHSHEASTINGD